jgi:hypothetical protein
MEGNGGAPGVAGRGTALPTRQFLVFVRAGPQTLHPEWLTQDPDRNWDCIVNWWGREPPDCGEELKVAGTGNTLLKLDSFAEFYNAHRDLVAQYSHVLIADDDLRFPHGGISRLFEICSQRRLPLAQAALRWGTWVNHPVTMHNPFTEVRQVSYVEVMMPVFAAPTLESLIDTFLLTRSGNGVDWAWAYRLQGQQSIFIVDSVRVEHTKPLDLGNGQFYKLMRSVGVDPWLDWLGMRRIMPIPGGIRTLPDGHVYRRGLPRSLGRILVYCYSQFGRVTYKTGISNRRLIRRLSRWRMAKGWS